MADNIQPDAATAAPAKAAHGKSGAHRHAHHSFHRALVHAGSHRAGSHHAGGYAAARPRPTGGRVAALSEGVEGAIRTAMAREAAPESWTDSLCFLVAKESGGQVDVQHPRHSARGLFQLTAANYPLNPRGAASFGNAVEEAQGGIRYIRARYGTAEAAAEFWREKGWY